MEKFIHRGCAWSLLVLAVGVSLRTAVADEMIDDASRLNSTSVYQVISMHKEEDVRQALKTAHRLGRHVSISGRRHSMGGQTFDAGNIVLDMLPFNGLSFDTSTFILTAQSGAQWIAIQKYLDERGRSVKIMQSDNIFSVGGTLSVNAHGWQPKNPPIDSTVESFRIMLSSGEIKTCSRLENADLFHAVLGGYGLLGVILDVRLDTAPNVWCRAHSYVFPAKRYTAEFKKHVDEDPAVELAYGRMSVDSRHFLTEAFLMVYDDVPNAPSGSSLKSRWSEKMAVSTTTPLAPMTPESSVTFKNKVFRLSERRDEGKLYRWMLEKEFNRLSQDQVLTRNSAMNADINVLKPQNPAHRDILQEYFVPYGSLESFLGELRKKVPLHQLNLLNITLRDVRRDADSDLAYARGDYCAMVLFFAQEATSDGEKRMSEFTGEMVDAALKDGGSFYLPYRLHYTQAQFSKAYPAWRAFLQKKQRYDPSAIFSSRFYRYAFLNQNK